MEDAFALSAGGPAPNYQVQIVDTIMQARKATLNLAFQVYPLRPVDCKVHSVPQGAKSHTHENLFICALSIRLVVCCIYNDS